MNCRPLTLFASVACLLLACGPALEGQEPEPTSTLDTQQPLTCGRVSSGQTLSPGTLINSCNGKFVLAMQSDGNLVQYSGGRPLWATATNGSGGAWAVMQSDGNLVVYSRDGRALWGSGTNGNEGAGLAVQDDGNVVISSSGGKALWASQSQPALVPCGLNEGAELGPGQSVKSCNAKYGLWMQGDGNLVIYGADGHATWSTRTDGSGANRAVMQTDGNLVLYTAAGKAVWSSATSGHPFSALAMQDDGNLVLYSRSWLALWSSGSAAQAPSPGGSIAVPASLVALLSPKPYVEQNCSSASYPGWPYAAQRCSYSSGGKTTSVTVADPSADRAAQWVVDSASLIPALARLKGSDQGHYEEGLRAIGLAMLYQSSRIFPLSGGIIENMGSGYVNYSFEKGVTTTCGSGCYCRINSLHRTEWCDYQSALGRQSSSACLNQVGSSGYTQGWANECFENHKRSFESPVNEHFRAKAFIANRTVAARFGGGCSGAQGVAAVKAAYGL